MICPTAFGRGKRKLNKQHIVHRGGDGEDWEEEEEEQDVDDHLSITSITSPPLISGVAHAWGVP